MKKLLWIGHSGTLQTGFGRVAQNILHYAHQSWDVAVLGIGYDGDPHTMPYKIYPAGNRGDQWGMNRLEHVYFGHKPDVTCIVMEPWNIAEYVKNLRAGLGSKPKIVAYAVIDGENVKAEHAHWLSQCDVCIFPTDFAVAEAKKAGYHGYGYVIPHGVNPVLYRPCNKQWARKQIGLSNLLDEDAFIFNNVNMNQPRKRIDLSIEAFALFLERAGNPPQCMLNLHLSKKMEEGWDIGQLATYFDVRGRISVIAEEIKTVEENMKYVYNAADVQITTTAGEGFGLTTLEGMACGIAQIVPDFSALGDWAKPACVAVPVSDRQIMSKQQNVVRRTPTASDVADAMVAIYQDAEMRKRLGRMARKYSLQETFRWSTIASGFEEAFIRALDGPGVSGTILAQAEANTGTGPSGTPLAISQQ